MIYRIHYNWFYCTQFGEHFEDFTVGNEHVDPATGEMATVTKIIYDRKCMMAEVFFSNGTQRIQNNLNAVLFKEEDESENDKDS